MERYWKRKNNFGKSGRKSKRTKSKSSEKDRKQQVSHLKLEWNTANNRNKTDNVLENINTEQRERKIYSRLIYIHELSGITKEIIKQDEVLGFLLNHVSDLHFSVQAHNVMTYSSITTFYTPRRSCTDSSLLNWSTKGGLRT